MAACLWRPRIALLRKKQIGTCIESWARTCSGDMYETVPMVVPGLVRCDGSSASAVWVPEIPEVSTRADILASSKSKTLARSPWVTNIFAGLMSRCTVPLVRLMVFFFRLVVTVGQYKSRFGVTYPAARLDLKKLEQAGVVQPLKRHGHDYLLLFAHLRNPP